MMSENNGDQGQEPEVESVVKASIWLDMNTNKIKIEGPIHNTILFLGMLEMAKVTIIEMRATANKQDAPIIVPDLRLPPM